MGRGIDECIAVDKEILYGTIPIVNYSDLNHLFEVLQKNSRPIANQVVCAKKFCQLVDSMCEIWSSQKEFYAGIQSKNSRISCGMV